MAGYLGVDLFFALSGFVIGLVYEDRLASGELTVARFAEARLVRLYPMVLLGLALGGATVGLGALPVGDRTARLLAAAFMVPTLWLPGNLFSLNGPQWSLFWELAANAIYAGIRPWLTTARVVAIVVSSGLLVAATAWSHGGVSVGFLRSDFALGLPRVCFSFFLGLLLYRLWRAERLPALPRAGWLALPGFVIGVVAAGYARSALVDLVVLFVVVPSATVGAIGARADGVRRRAAQVAGRLSYPIYALQVAAINLWGSMLPPISWLSWRRVGVWLLLVVVLVAAAALIELHVDRPIRRYLTSRLALRRSRSMVVTAP